MGKDIMTVLLAGQMSLPEATTAEQFKAWMDDAQRWAASVGYVQEDVELIVKNVRQRKLAWGSRSVPTL